MESGATCLNWRNLSGWHKENQSRSILERLHLEPRAIFRGTFLHAFRQKGCRPDPERDGKFYPEVCEVRDGVDQDGPPNSIGLGSGQFETVWSAWPCVVVMT